MYADRYWGESSPYSELNAETLQYLTLEQSIADLVHFAKTVNLPFDTNGSSNADKAVGLLPRPGSLMTVADWFIPAVGALRRLLQWCFVCMDRENFPGDFLGVPLLQCPGSGSLRLCMWYYSR